MKAITAYIKGWKKVLKHKRMSLLLYGLNLFVAMLSLIPLSGFLKKTLAHSLMANKMLTGFDYTFLTDFYHQYGQGISLILNQSIGFIILFFVFSVFMMGGILSVFKHTAHEFSFAQFWKGCGKYFWRLLRLTIYFLIIQGVIFVFFGWLFLQMVGSSSPFGLESELVLVNNFKILFPIYVFVITLFFMIQDYTKIHLVQEDQIWLTQPIKQSFQIVFNNIIPFSFLYLLNILTLLLLFGIYWIFKNQLNVNSLLSIFVLSQLFIFGRVVIRLLNLSSATYLYQNRKK